MASIETALLYFFLFVSLYLEIFLLATYFGRRTDIKKEGISCPDTLKEYPSVTIVVPCYNEEKTVQKTVDSLLAIDYPREKLGIFVIDDGSKDSTWNVIQKYRDNPQVTIHRKENGGKYTALNYGIEHSTTDFIGCLDADSLVDAKTLKKIMKRFEEDPVAMAVTPAIRIYKPSTIVQFIQSTEYTFTILIKKIMAFLGAIYVTPGPFTIFKRDVFKRIGMFRDAHNTEDMEIAFRMQAHHLKIENVHNAWVYTVGPNTIKKLYKQRLRWTHGFIENAKDYRHLFFKREYGNLGFLTLPITAILIVGVVTSVFIFVKQLATFLFYKFLHVKTVGLASVATISFDRFNWFYINTKLSILLAVAIFVLMLTIILTAHRIVTGRARPTKSLLYFLVVYPFISPLWVLKSVYNTIFSKKTSWR